MPILYAVLLFAVGLAILAITVSAVISVSRPMDWSRHDASRARELHVVDKADRRVSQLPYLGHERRGGAEHDDAQEIERAA
jgi:hypothetical protein